MELVKVEVYVVAEAEAHHEAQREERDRDPALGQLARPANQARVAAAQLDQLRVLDVEKRLQNRGRFHKAEARVIKLRVKTENNTIEFCSKF